MKGSRGFSFGAPMGHARLNLTSATDLIHAGIQAQFRDAIKARLLADLTPLVEEAATELAKTVVAQVHSYQCHSRQEAVIEVHFREKVTHRGPA